MLYLGEYQRVLTSNGKIRMPAQWMRQALNNSHSINIRFLIVEAAGVLARIIEYDNKEEPLELNEINDTLTMTMGFDAECEKLIETTTICNPYGWIQLPEECLSDVKQLSDRKKCQKQFVFLIGIGNGFDILFVKL